MGALIDQYGIGEACARALQAGIDTILMKAENHWRGEMFYTIRKWVEDGRINAGELDDKVRRVLAMKLKYGLFDNMGIVDAARAAESYQNPVIIETSKRAAQNAIMVPKDELGVLPLDRSRKVLLINQQNSIKCPNDRYDHPSLFQEIMEETWPALQTYETAFGSTPEQDDAVVRFVEANDFDLILCTNYYDRQEKPNTYARQLIDAGKPVALITNTPYCIKEHGGCIPCAKTIILNMNLTPEGLRTAKKVLFGELQPKARWPLANYDPFSLAD